MKATCLVRAGDYRRHWGGDTSREQVAWNWAVLRSLGKVAERRSGVDRRAPGHERRWEASRGRRLRLADRRQAR